MVDDSRTRYQPFEMRIFLRASRSDFEASTISPSGLAGFEMGGSDGPGKSKRMSL
jgi:hypothetical protein